MNEEQARKLKENARPELLEILLMIEKLGETAPEELDRLSEILKAYQENRK